MSRTYFLSPDGNDYRANMHNHTTVSDGRLTPEEIKKEYSARGYSIVAFTDHEVLVPHNELSDDRFLALTSSEIAIRPADRSAYPNRALPCYHINVFSPDKERDTLPSFDRTGYSVAEVNQTLETFTREGFLTQYNHPRWSLQTASDFVGLKNLWGYEIYNTSCDSDMFNAWGDYEYETFCRFGGADCLPVPSMGDDNHNAYPIDSAKCDSFGGVTVIRANSLDYASVFDAMKRKNCYSTMGPVIRSVYAENGVLTVETSPVAALMFLSDTRAKQRFLSLDDDITSASFEIPEGDETWFRIEMRDKAGNRAFFRAISKAEILATKEN